MKIIVHITCADECPFFQPGTDFLGHSLSFILAYCMTCITPRRCVLITREALVEVIDLDKE